MLEEDVAFSSIAQNEIGHARAVYSLVAGEDGDVDALAFDRQPDEYRCAPFVELKLLDWAHTIARRWLYEVADEIRISALKASLPLAAKIDREETYHRMHAEMWHERLSGAPQFRAAVEELWPYALGVLAPMERQALASRVGLGLAEPVERGSHADGFGELLDEMTSVRRSAPAGAQW